MSDLVGNPEDRFSHNEAQLHFSVIYLLFIRLCVIDLLPICLGYPDMHCRHCKSKCNIDSFTSLFLIVSYNVLMALVQTNDICANLDKG